MALNRRYNTVFAPIFSFFLAYHRSAQNAEIPSLISEIEFIPKSAKSMFQTVRGLCDLTPKARKCFFTEVLSQRAHFLVYRRPRVVA